MLTPKAANSGNSSVNLAAMVKGTIYALIIASLLNLMAGSIMYYSAVSDLWLGSIATFIFGLSIFCGGIVASFKASNKGLLHGISVGIIFLVAASLISGLMDSSTITGIAFLKKALSAIIAGGMGGILGVSLSK